MLESLKTSIRSFCTFGVIGSHIRRLVNYGKSFLTPNTKVLFDKDIRDIFIKYEKEPGMTRRVTESLRHVKDPEDGCAFGKSIKNPAKLLDAVAEFEKESPPNLWGRSEHYRNVIERHRKYFSRWHVTPLNYSCDEDVIMAIPKMSTNAGYSGIESGKTKKRDNVRGIFKKMNRMIELAMADPSKNFRRIAIPAVRTQCGHGYEENGKLKKTCKHKTRLVWMIDILVIAVQCMFFNPFFSKFKKLDWYAGGKTPAELRTIIGRLKHKGYYWWSFDYSGWDAKFNQWHMGDCMSIYRCAFDLNPKQEKIFNIMTNSMLEKWLSVGDKLHHVFKGMASGELLTQVIDTIGTKTANETYFDYLGWKENVDYWYIGLGDDGLYITKREINLTEMESYIQHCFGYGFSAAKCDHGKLNETDPEFLSRRWRVDGEWIPGEWLIEKACYPQRYRKYDDLVRPEYVVFGYITGYGAAMREFMDVDRFLFDYNLQDLALNSVDRRNLPGILYYLNLSESEDLEKAMVIKELDSPSESAVRAA